MAYDQIYVKLPYVHFYFISPANICIEYLYKTIEHQWNSELDVGLYEEKYDGFYAVASNPADNVKDILAINEQLYHIRNCYRMLKTDFASRPYFHRTRERIIAHFMIYILKPLFLNISLYQPLSCAEITILIFISLYRLTLFH